LGRVADTVLILHAAPERAGRCDRWDRRKVTCDEPRTPRLGRAGTGASSADANKMTPMSTEWMAPEHALAYLRLADRIPHRTEGEATLLEEVPKEAIRVLDLGSGDARLLGLLLACSAARGVAVEFSPLMLE
jgi:hypothetical protein